MRIRDKMKPLSTPSTRLQHLTSLSFFRTVTVTLWAHSLTLPQQFKEPSQTGDDHQEDQITPDSERSKMIRDL